MDLIKVTCWNWSIDSLLRILNLVPGWCTRHGIPGAELWSSPGLGSLVLAVNGCLMHQFWYSISHDDYSNNLHIVLPHVQTKSSQKLNNRSKVGVLGKELSELRGRVVYFHFNHWFSLIRLRNSVLKGKFAPVLSIYKYFNFSFSPTMVQRTSRMPREEREEFNEIQAASMGHFLLPLYWGLAPRQPGTGHVEEPAEGNCNYNRVKCLASLTPSCSSLLCSHVPFPNSFCLVLHTVTIVITGILLVAWVLQK